MLKVDVLSVDRCSCPTSKKYSMPKESVLLWSALLLLMFGISISYADTVQLPQTGQTTCYDKSGSVIVCNDTNYPGEDGELQAGAVWPVPRFTANAEATQTDNMTGLIWVQDGSAPKIGTCYFGTMAWLQAMDYIACLNSNNYLGHNDWRLPNINELESLMNYGQADVATWLNSQGFINVKYYAYWSSTTNASNTSKAWGISTYQEGTIGFGDKTATGAAYVWPVRGQSGAFAPSAVWRTGQHTSYHAGDDGALQQGVAWPSPRFIDSNNQTVTDNLTNLMWTKDANAPGPISCYGGAAATWQGALNYIACLNANNFLGYTDWRLPNRKEQYSLMDFSQYNPSLPAGNPFINVQSVWESFDGDYWTSTSNEFSPDSAWYLDIYHGNVQGDHVKSNYSLGYVWPVRGSGQSYLLSAHISGTGKGTLASSTQGVNCSGNICSGRLKAGAKAVITATAAIGSTVVSWTGCDTVSGHKCTVVMNAAKTVTANIALNTTLPDLIISALSSPTYACRTQTISIKDTTQNHGTVLSAGSSQTCFYFSANSKLESADLKLSCRSVPTLVAGAYSTATTAMSQAIPANTAIGKYYVIADANDTRTVVESNYSNNTKSKAIYIGSDLKVTSLVVPTSASARATISITYTIKNAGCGTAGASTTAFYLSTSKKLVGATLLGSRSLGSLGTNASSTGTTTVTIPSGLSAGTYYIIANANDGKTATESNYTNNTMIKTITIR